MSNPGQVALAVVGGVVGAFVGGPTGAAYGIQIGLAVGSVVSPTQLPGTFGPRLNDKRTTTAQLGEPITELYGTDVVAGTVIWLGDVTEHADTEEVGGKGAPQGENTTFSYTQSIAIGLCKGPRSGIRRIWENGKLVYDSRVQQSGESSDDYSARLAAAIEYASGLTIYAGDESQLPDPTIELKEGVGNVPAFRGLMYIVYTDRALKDDQGQRHPSFKFEIGEPDITSLVALASSVFSTAVGKSVMTSADAGASWTMRSTTATGWIALASSPLLYKIIAVNTGGGVMQSVDGGVTWTVVGSGIPGGAAIDVVWADSLALFVAISTSSIFTSPDGIVWTQQVEPAGRIYRAIVWMRTLRRLAVMAFNSSNAAPADIYSDDAINWVSAATPRPFPPFTMATNAGGSATDGQGLLFTGSGFGETFYSADGNIYSRVTDANNGSQPGGAHASGGSRNPGEYIFGWGRGANFQITRTVDNGAHWAGITSGVQKRDVSEVLYYLDKYILIYSDTNVSGPGPQIFQRAVATSPDGLTWTAQVTPAIADNANWSDLWYTASPAANGITLAEIVARICASCGLADDMIDVSDLEGVSVYGYKVDRITDGRSAISVLRQIGFFDAVESNVVKFVRRGAAPARTLLEDDLGAHEYGSETPAAVTTTSTQEVELARQLFVQYRDPARDYEDGQQASPTRLITDAINDKFVDIAVAVDATQALRAAETLWADEWAGRWKHTIALDAAHSDLEPTDVVLVPIDGRLERLRITSIEDSAGLLRSLTCVRDDDGSYVSSVIAEAPGRDVAPLLILAGSSILLLDLPPLRLEDTDAGIYAAAQRTTAGNRWGGLAIYRGLPGGALSALASVTNEAVAGTLTSALASADSDVFDDSSQILVTLLRGQFESRSDIDLLDLGANTLAVGVNGRWELVQFGVATQLGPTSWKLTHLLRGRRGTEHNIGTSQIADQAVLVSGLGILRLPVPSTDVGTDLQYRAATIGATLASGTDLTYASTGESLKPFSPVHVTASDAGGGDILIEWTRRDRLAIEFTDPLPLSEASERYELDVISDSSPQTVLRTLASSVESVTYTGAQRVDDFGSPGPTAILVRIYQIGALGRGHVVESMI